MKRYSLWQQKLIAFFHDPPSKPFIGIGKVGGHKKIADQLFDAFQANNKDRKWRHYFKAGDWAASGADRPLLYVPRGTKGVDRVYWHKKPVITHPLAPGHRMELHGDAGVPPAEEDTLAVTDEVDLAKDLIGDAEAITAELADLVTDWGNEDQLRQASVVLWRRFRSDLIKLRGYDPLWQEMPAESRCPDHAIWDHLKVVSALAFLKPHKMMEKIGDEGAQQPWMLRMGIGPVGRFIGESRSSRDLWISSFLLSDLAWHLMQPIVERYGADCIVYPDLHANPRADAWLKRQPDYGDDLRDVIGDATSFAAMIPDNFVALLPLGGEGELPHLAALCAEAVKAMEDRWRQLADRVRDWIAANVRPEDDDWRAIWIRQHGACPIHATWVAVPWLPMGRIGNVASLRTGAPMPCQTPGEEVPEHDRTAIAERAERLSPWMSQKIWAHYENARFVYAASSLGYHQMERGFDYALTHHQLMVRHRLREAADSSAVPPEEPGEKCTLCGTREALRLSPVRHGNPRQAARAFWSHESLDPDRSGAERLCAICATKRFLVVADTDGTTFNHLWGTGEDRDRDGKYRVPFPSTATVAAQDFLVRVATDPGLAGEREAVVRAARTAGLPRTSFPRALPRLADAAAGEGRSFLEFEAEDMLFPEVLEGKRGASALSAEKKNGLKDLQKAVRKLRAKATETAGKEKPAAPETGIAVLRLDGDAMGMLLLGDPERIATTWKDVLHPDVLDRLPKAEYLNKAGWPSLLGQKRLMGPTLHAFVSRALGHFSHTIVPWVVEREFGGRLIYAGGDDLLCLAPAAEAVDLAARLQQLFSAAWVIDTSSEEPAWGWRRGGRRDERGQDDLRRRFAIPVMPGDGGLIRLNDPSQLSAPHVADGPEGAADRRRLHGLLMPMLGSGSSLSAGIALAHYKTPLSVLLRRSADLLRMAKAAGGAHLAIGHASRGGDKTTVCLPWTLSEGDEALHSARDELATVIQGFRTSLPGRLPYKLRETAEPLHAVLKMEPPPERRDALLRGLFLDALDSGSPGSAGEAAFRLWRHAVGTRPAKPDGWADALLLCRAIAGGIGKEEDEA